MRKVPIVRDFIPANRSFLLANSTCSMENAVGKYLEDVGMFVCLFVFRGAIKRSHASTEYFIAE